MDPKTVSRCNRPAPPLLLALTLAARGAARTAPGAAATLAADAAALLAVDARFDAEVAVRGIEAATGNYCTLWRRQADADWKVVFDLGSEDPTPAPASRSSDPR